MEPDERVEREVRVREERCRVTAVKVRADWQASGTHQGKVVEVRRAASADQAFEWWQNKAGMMQPDD